MFTYYHSNLLVAQEITEGNIWQQKNTTKLEQNKHTIWKSF